MIYTVTPHNIWAGGRGKNLYHYDGSKWETDSINIYVPPAYDFGVSSISSYNSNTYAIGGSYNINTGETTNYFFKKLNDAWAVQDSFSNFKL